MVIEVYSDGSGNSFGKPGGFAYAIIVDGVKVHEDSGGEVNATNNTMELRAALEGLQYVHGQPQYEGADITLVSDSQLVLGFATGRWQCKKQHLLLAATRLKTLFIRLKAKDRWCKGHSGIEWNEYVDKLAGAARETLVKSSI